MGISGPWAPSSDFFRIIQEGLAGLVDGEHLFDLPAEDVVVEYVVSVPGYPRRVEGRRVVAHFVSVLTIRNRQVSHWRDHLDPVAVFRALGRPARAH